MKPRPAPRDIDRARCACRRVMRNGKRGDVLGCDDHLLAAASAIFDGLLAAFVKEEQPDDQGFSITR